MSVRTRRLALALLLWSCLGTAHGQEPRGDKKELEQLPPPRLAMPPAIAQYYLVPPRTDTRYVWSLYAPDSAGRLRPRVILSPYVSYYLQNGQPYPWTTTQPQLILPRTGD
jgi:hypothetical protein